MLTSTQTLLIQNIKLQSSETHLNTQKYDWFSELKGFETRMFFHEFRHLWQKLEQGNKTTGVIYNAQNQDRNSIITM